MKMKSVRMPASRFALALLLAVSFGACSGQSQGHHFTDDGDAGVDDGDAGVEDCQEECDENATCSDTGNGYACVCGDGYQGDGLTCILEEEPLPTIRALCVIADFADSALEDYHSAPAGSFTSVEDVESTLSKMGDHWAWMSRERQQLEWDIIRVQLPENLTEDAYPSWWDFRTAVVQLAGEQIDFADYDIDGDDELDMMWIITSSQGEEYDYAMGGMSSQAGANTYVDGQSSLSVIMGAIGNFNHEGGHCRGLPDIYGDFDNVGFLSLMSDSWPVPPFGFSAWERIKLGWIEPTVIEETTTGVTLLPAESYLHAVKIPVTDDEYFLVEYRKRTESGFGSATGQEFNGLAIYHVDESRWGNGDNFAEPPLLRLERADGVLGYGTAPMADDLWYPGNENMLGSFGARTHLNPLSLFHIENFAWKGAGIQFDVVFVD